jgi:hypothetical protein
VSLAAVHCRVSYLTSKFLAVQATHDALLIKIKDA